MNKLWFQKIIRKALEEDLGMGDLTTNSIFTKDTSSAGTFTAKNDGVLSGLDCISLVYEELDDSVSVELLKKDGDSVSKGDIIATVKGPVRALLSGERVILNLIQHMSGIATSTNEVVSLLDDDSITITDTRKTLPGLRALQKYAVTCGGGKNHRFRLDDGVMIKDNHIKAAGSISKAVEMVRAKVGHLVKIEVETENKDQVLEAVDSGVDVIMLDNRNPSEVKEFVSVIPDGIIVEVSGGITPENIAYYKGCGAHVISLGWLTHSVNALDISFNLN
ncbi:MAG: carboxylating nicotinate-nucleotide diphosphorylase [Balneolaceae bacterium]|nr:carboxylating nicotinate-nucleotide diphosphorylase [Balneolaceae bacterium]MBO6545448.1 carboxylating nicotinate-nucleotide diphosphorylase [Balneolaceae bacterium]MBO6646844.1 carboxylating nicotinate-nucleotide diphosphorylase [Balneolaceae bacterium]